MPEGHGGTEADPERGFVAPTRDGRKIRLRCVVRPNKAQNVLLDHLGLRLPQRLEMTRGLRAM